MDAVQRHKMPSVTNGDTIEVSSNDSRIKASSSSPSGSTGTSMSSYVREFNSLFRPINPVQLRDKALTGGLRNSKFRSLCWRYFLHCLPDNYDQWIEKCDSDRKEYQKLTDEHAFDPRQVDHPIVENNPLSQDENSPWNQYFADSNLRNVIKQDVIRTYPDMEFFRSSEIQSILSNVLFHFARENPKLSYKQGMHELLASLLFVHYQDVQTCIIANEGGLANDDIAHLLDINFIEHDVYMTFSQLMQTIETWYQNDEIVPTRPDDANKYHDRHHVRSVLGLKLKMISEQIVKRHDSELYNHLEALQIAPQIYGIRWMRLLFGREFRFTDLLVVWDAIIGDGISLGLTDYLFASMLLTIRELLVYSDYTDCLNLLMRYPPVKDIQNVIKFALHLREPQRYHYEKSRSKGQNPQAAAGTRRSIVPSSTSLMALNRSQSREMYSIPAQQDDSLSPTTIGAGTGPGPSLTRTLGRKSTDSSSTYDQEDLHSKVDYCWRLLSDQIDSLQRCLPNEKNLNCEDEIYIALAQLKKVRDVLKGSLKLEPHSQSQQTTPQTSKKD